MACSTLDSRTEPCKELIGGIKGLFFINYAHTSAITKDVNDLITLIEATAGSAIPINAYYWEVKGLSSLEIGINSSRDSGNRHYDQILTISMKPKGATAQNGEDDNDVLDALAQGRWHVIVQDRNNQFRLLGEQHGMDANGGSMAWGAQVGDARLNTITLQGLEPKPPAMVTGSTYGDVAGTIVTVI